MKGRSSNVLSILLGSLLGAAFTWAYFRKQLFTDQLTKLPNRKAVPALLRRSMRRVNRNGTPLSVALLDLDDFKAVNTQFGYATADRLLEEFGETLRIFCCRHGIRALRYKSGDEFLLIMEHLPENRATEMLETLEEDTRKKTFISHGRPFQMRFCAGKATIERLSKPAELDVAIHRLLEACEQNLFAAKAKRPPCRNCAPDPQLEN
jgi:diguanylate cyclase (GGDEF)-like protein